MKDALAVFGTVFVIGEQARHGADHEARQQCPVGAAHGGDAREAVVMGVKAGLDPRVMIDVINCRLRPQHRNARTNSRKAILPRTFDLGFATALMLKDVRLCACRR